VNPSHYLPDPTFVLEGHLRSQAVQVTFIQHAAIQMRRRGVNADEVLRCLRAPDKIGLPVDEPESVVGWKRKRWGRFDDTGRRRLDVVFEEGQTDGQLAVTVVSVFWKSGEGI